MNNQANNLESELEEIVFKFILVGDTGVGKSSILLKYTEKRFENEHNVTVGVDFRSKVINYENKAMIKLQIWDTAGQETFGSIVRSFYRDAAAIFLVYNVKDKLSFEAVYKWLDEVKSNCETDPIYILVGNQADNEQGREVSYDEGVEFMKENDISFFFETSAADGKNIELAFMEATGLTYLNYIKERRGVMSGKSSLNLKDARAGERLTVDRSTSHKKPNPKGCC